MRRQSRCELKTIGVNTAVAASASILPKILGEELRGVKPN